MSDFSDRPFASGSLIGLRAFETTLDGTLVGPTYPTAFKPGENEAQCFNDPEHGSTLLIQGIMGSMWGLTRKAVDVPVREARHPVGSRDCTCGYYAYCDGTNEYYTRREGRVQAIIEGYGVCTVGTRGFRAQKARLVALINTNPEDKDVRVWDVLTFVYLLGLAWFVAVTVMTLFSPYWFTVILYGGMSLVYAGLFVLRLKQRKLLRAKQIGKGQWKRIAAKYPDVPIFKSRKEAIAAFPLSDLSHE